MNRAEICLPANHLKCIDCCAAAAASTVSNRKYTKPAVFLHLNKTKDGNELLKF